MSLDEAALRRAFADLRARVAFVERALGLFVDDAELDKPKGNPKVKFAPRGWRGPDCVGRTSARRGFGLRGEHKPARHPARDERSEGDDTCT